MSASILGENKPMDEHLSVSSGNVQLLPTHHGDGLENQYPLPGEHGTRQPSHFPIPSIKLGSNDTPIRALDVRLSRNAVRQYKKKAPDPARPYLIHAKYLEYRSRPRQDIGKDGKPIWPDHIEAAFQDGEYFRRQTEPLLTYQALVMIPPMGRKKCSQHGRSYGRNMLIAEWIKKATGHKRERKQVSSHIQVLDRFLNGIPECQC
jgi:transcriptional enhancer factor